MKVLNSPLILLVICVNSMPESPRWLVKNGQQEEALKVLGHLRSDDGVVNEEAKREHAGIQTALALEAHASYSYFAMFFKNCGKLHMSRRVRQMLLYVG